MIKKHLLNNLSCCLMLLAFTLLGSLAIAQGVTTAAISGIVTDEKGEGIPGANVIAVHTPSGTQYGAATRVDGRYNFPNVRIGGPYIVTASFVGFSEQKREGINLSLGQDFTLNFNMKDASVQLSEVEVRGERNAVISTDRTGAATSVSNQQINRLPTLNRSFDDFTRLDPRANGQSFGGRNGGYNNITIDGALFNNSFGLSSTVGGQANAQPISLDAVDQIQVSIAPYDVRQGSFTGAAINAVTRSGTNELSGSIYYFLRNESFVGKKVDGQSQPIPSFDLKNTGFRLGGPIIKNKLFFFVNGEIERRNDPPRGGFVAFRGTKGSNVSEASATRLDSLSTFLSTKYGYNAGPYENYQLEQNSSKITAKIDWNISKAHRFNIKYNYLKSYRDVNPSTSGALANGGNPSTNHLPYLAAYYRINNNLNSVIAELNSTFSSRFSNTFQAGYTAFRDFRESSGGVFPLVNIGNGSGSSFTTFGYEPFSANNILNTDVYQFSDNFTIYAGKQVFTIGTYNEFYKFKNGFAPNYYGAYQFASVADFYSSANQTINPATGKISNPTQYQLQYSALPGGFPFVDIKASQLGFYVQDEISLKSNLKVTAGLRADIPIIASTVLQNEAAANLTFRDGVKLNTGKVPETAVLWSPRVGFNWDVFDNKRTQVRGGTGIFTGRVPYVWISNQASNNGLLFGSEFLTNPTDRPFSADVDKYRPANALANTSYNLAVTEPDFKFPQVWRTNVGVDQVLPGGIIATLDGLYTADINSVYHANVNLPSSTVTAKGADNRPIFYNTNENGIPTTARNQLYPVLRDNTGKNINTLASPNITNAILMRNTNQGYSYSLTAQLQKQFNNGIYASLAYTYSDSRSVNDGGSIAQSIWRDRQISGDPNANDLSYSNFLQKDRIIASVSYRKEYFNFAATTVSFFYTGAPNNTNFSTRYSYTYAGDMNGDGSGGGGNDLIYVPRNQSEIELVNIAATSSTPAYSKEQQWADLDAYISQDKYLSKRRGQYAERNGASNPFVSTLDFKILQDFFIKAGGKRNTLQFSLDVFNLGNLLSSKWGVPEQPARTALLSFVAYDAQGRPTFRYPLQNGQALRETDIKQTGINARWQMQFGIRYIFN